MIERLAATLRALIAALDEPEQDWRAIEAIWHNASAWAIGTPYEEVLHGGSLALRLHYTDRLRAAAQQALARLECN